MHGRRTMYLLNTKAAEAAEQRAAPPAKTPEVLWPQPVPVPSTKEKKDVS